MNCCALDKAQNKTSS